VPDWPPNPAGLATGSSAAVTVCKDRRGVEYYHVDYVGLRKRFCSAEGGMTATSINYEGLPPVAPEFDAAASRANL
jgi:hypothetical protein